MTELYLTRYCRIQDGRATINGREVFALARTAFAEFSQALYQYLATPYPKFHKMDNQSKLGILAADLLFRDTSFLHKYTGEEVSIVLSNAVASEEADARYFETVSDQEDNLPSPALFVYTLPSIVTGEICIKYKLKGENAFFVSEVFEAGLLHFHISTLMKTMFTQACIGGWVNYEPDHFDAFLFTVEASPAEEGQPMNATVLHHIYSTNLWTH